MDIEFRKAIDTWRGLDFRMESADGKTVHGYAAVFDSPSEDMGGFREIIAPGAFKESLSQKKRDLKAFVNHDWGRLLATRHAGTLELEEDAYGLRSVIHLPDTQDGHDIGVLTQRKDIHSMSFGFVPKKTDPMDNGKTEVIRAMALFEVSPVTAWPAYRATSASVRFLADLVHVDEDELGAALRVLTSADGELTQEQRDLLERAVIARAPQPVLTPLLDEWRSKLEAIAAS